MNDRIEPWERLPDTYFPISTFSERVETIGTKVIFDGVTVRAKGPYSTDLAAALVATIKGHAQVEGAI